MLRPKTYIILQQALEQGIKSGLHRAYKHTDVPKRDDFEYHLMHSICAAIFEYFDVLEDENRDEGLQSRI